MVLKIKKFILQRKILLTTQLFCLLVGSHCGYPLYAGTSEDSILFGLTSEKENSDSKENSENADTKETTTPTLSTFSSGTESEDTSPEETLKEEEEKEQVAVQANPDPETEKLAREVGRLGLEVKRLQLEREKQDLQQQNGSVNLQQKKDKITLEKELLAEKAQLELVELTAQKDRFLLENELQTAKDTREVATLNATNTRLGLENAIKEGQQLQVQAELQAEVDKLALQNALQAEKNKQYQLKIELETAKLAFEGAKLELEKAKRSLDVEELQRKILERNSQEEWKSQVNKPPKYLKEPFVEGSLILSDRQIRLEEIIWSGTADYVAERVHYFNNQSTDYPIFLIITNCYGGSAMDGARILKTMKESQAPVYVVVESFAASMGAVIATLAERSYALPNAVILHHQVWGIFFGNPTEVKEQMKIVDEWTKRILKPVAQKMGLTTEDFVKQMYEHSAMGNWMEFADVATKLKWVDTVVEEIRDTSLIKKPQDEAKPEEMMEETLPMAARVEKSDDKGQRYVKLPRLSHPNFYYLYNPDSYYR